METEKNLKQELIIWEKASDEDLMNPTTNYI